MSHKVLKIALSCCKTLVLIGVGISLVACSPKRGKGSAEGEVMGGGDTMRFFGTNLSPAERKALLAQNTYYFGYDKFDVNDADTASIYAHAKRLINSPRSRVRVEGHTDERGSGEYNVALGERRAYAIVNILLLKGVNQNQISVVSYGKEKPATFGHDEGSWSKNRRAVIEYEVE